MRNLSGGAPLSGLHKGNREWLLISDIDGTLTGDDAALVRLMQLLEQEGDRIAFGVASGRSEKLVAEAVAGFGLLKPELVIAAAGSEIAEPRSLGEEWATHISADWDRGRVERVLTGVRGLRPQDSAGQGEFKLSWLADVAAAELARRVLAAEGLHVNAVHSHGQFLDVMPAGADKGSAVRFAAGRLGFSLDRTIVAGDSGNDEAMLLCGARTVLVANFDDEIAHLADRNGIFTAPGRHAAGVIDGLIYHGAIAG